MIKKIFLMVILFSFAAIECTWGLTVTNNGGNAYTIKSNYQVIDWKSDSSIWFKWKSSGVTYASLNSNGDFPYSYNRAYGDSGKTRSRTGFNIDSDSTNCTITETWKFLHSGSADFTQVIKYSITDDKPYITINLSTINDTSSSKVVTTYFRPKYTTEYGTPNRVVAFHQDTSKHPIDQPLDSSNYIFSAYNNFQMLADYNIETITGSDLFLPIVCPYNTSKNAGMMYACDPRIAFAFEARNGNSQGMNKNFYLQAQTGAADDGIDVMDGSGKVPYNIYFGYVEKPHWSRLYDIYLQTSPFIQNSPAIPDVDAVSGLPNAYLDDEMCNKLVELGIKTIMISNPIIRDSNNLTYNWLSSGVNLAHSKGLKTLLWFTSSMAPDTNLYPKYDSIWDYRRFPNDLVKNQDGSTATCWDGMRANLSLQSPFTFGAKHIQRLKDCINNFGYDGVFMDFFGDLASLDYGHTTAQFPFFPLQVAETDYSKTLSDWLHANNKIFYINYPHPSLMVGRFADAVSYDTGSGTTFGLWYKLYSNSVRQPAVLLGGVPGDVTPATNMETELKPGLFYGLQVPAWNMIPATMGTNSQWIQDYTTSKFLFSSNSSLGNIIGKSKLVYGDASIGPSVGNKLYFKGDNGIVFVTMRNNGTTPMNLSVPIDLNLTGLSTDSHYTVYRWDIENGASLFSNDITGSTLANGLSVTGIPAKAVQILIITPFKTGQFTDTGMFWFSRDIQSSFESTHKISNPAWDSGTNTFSFQVSGISGTRSSTTFHLPTVVRPGNISITGCTTSSIFYNGNTIGISITHTADPATVTISNLVTGATVTGSIEGRVVSKISGSPIAGASIELENGQTVPSDANGRYKMPALAGTYIVAASKDLYLTENVPGITVKNGEITNLDISLVNCTNMAVSTNWADKSKFPNVTATDSGHRGGAASAAIDGLGSTLFQSLLTISPIWLMIDLGQVRSIGGFAMIGDPESNHAPQKFHIQIGSATADAAKPVDDPSWTDVVSVDNGTLTDINRAFSFNPVSGQRVRIYVESTGVNQAFDVAEIAVMSGTAAANYPRGADTGNFDPSLTPYDEPWYAIDGNPNSVSSSASAYKYQTCWQMFDLGPDKVVGKIVLHMPQFSSTLMKKFRVQYGGASADPNQPETGTDWTDIAVYTNNTDYDVTIDLKAPVSAQRIRIFKNLTSPRMAFTEVEIYATANIQITSPPDILNKGWNLITIPMAPVSDDPKVVLNSVDMPNASLQLWDNASQSGGGYLNYGINWFGPMKRGEAYWLVSDSNKTISYQCYKDDQNSKKIIIPAHSKYPYWVLIGNPLNRDMSCALINFNTDIDTSPVGWFDASGTKGWIESTVQGFDAAAQGYVIVSPSVVVSNINWLSPWKGYWLLVKTPNELTMTFPPQ